jgi:octanoyl-[GcvH]:protein N-octanoyltransferase
MCESCHSRNVPFTLHTQRLNSPSAALRALSAAFPADPYLETATSAALMRQVARGEVAPAIRLNRTPPILAFGKLDRLRPGYRRAVAIAREAGYVPVERIAGGRAAVFHEGTISFSHAIRAGGGSGSYAGTRERFVAMAATIAAAGSALGADARVGEVPGEYCPGEFSVNAAARVKLAGIGQRVIVGGAHVGAVIVVRGAGRINEVLEPVYEALGLDFDPDATGSIASVLGEPDDPLPLDESDWLIEATVAALRAELAKAYELRDVELDGSTLELAERTKGDYRPRV